MKHQEKNATKLTSYSKYRMKGGITMKHFNNSVIFDVNNLFNEHLPERNKIEKHNTKRFNNGEIFDIQHIIED